MNNASDILTNTVYDYINNTLVKVVAVDKQRNLCFVKENYKIGEKTNNFGLNVWRIEDFTDEIINNQEKIRQSNLKAKEQELKYLEEKKKQEEFDNWILYRENFCNGFTDKMTAMKKANVIKVLNKVFRYNGRDIRARKDNVIIYLRNGYLPQIKTRKYMVKEYSGFYERDIEKEKEIFVLIDKDNTYLEITKTEHDYANYILNELGLENAKLTNELEEIK